MALIDVKERIRKKKRRRRRRILIFLVLIGLTGLTIASFTSSWLDVKEVEFMGNKEIPMAFLNGEGEKLKGENLLLLSKNEVKSLFEEKPYFASMEMKKEFPNKVKITITEREAEINYLSHGVIHLLTREGILLESGANMLPEGLLLMDQEELPEIGNNLYEENEIKQKLIEEFRELQLRNHSEIHFTQLDLSDPTNVKTYYEELEVWLGYPDALKEKLNAAINIIMEGQMEQVKGYVDVSYLEKPVFYDESVLTPTEPMETPGEIPEDLEEVEPAEEELN